MIRYVQSETVVADKNETTKQFRSFAQIVIVITVCSIKIKIKKEQLLQNNKNHTITNKKDTDDR